jgi:hypothetical protein
VVDKQKDPRLLGKRDGSTVNQAPFQLPVVEHKGHRADAQAITRSKNKPLRRKILGLPKEGGKHNQSHKRYF